MKPELKVVLIYIAVGVFWILLSDKILLLIFGSNELEQIAYLQTVKGVFYVAMTGLLLYLLIRKYYEAMDKKVKELEVLNNKLEQKSKELENSNKDLEQFAFVISHDLQEPLRMVTSFLSQLQKKYGMQLDEKAQKYIFFAVNGAQRMKQIILDLLEFSRVGIYHENKEDIELNELLKEVKQDLRLLIAESKAKIQIEKLPILHIHRTPILQIFKNLLTNSLKYRSEDRPTQIELGVNDKADFWEFWIKDNGIGIEEEYFERIFVIFQRLFTADQYGGGTGIGLALVKKTVESYGGEISLQSKLGEGTTFFFTLPK
ncbi:Phytochrome, two-component sensor histidine kinase [Indibacter alkaliphilus LW1]|uniref:histidine kinase n=1 Tax=Indibacter alkaliphilus (strain CCUG 57479 / KCTC 22604 / LW1) TaxID=1189612 RepID=S2DIA3_INDAL|nr:ATP-binding protein [Indibacter alkaliphilus]EOZ98732.1 Phytochrome, two-component sensor histidine kinase [Indibacter alkaliphilus LW1]